VIAKCKAFANLQSRLDANRLVFVDESGFRLGSPPRHGWAPLGHDSPGYGTHGNWKTITMIGAIALDGFRATMTIKSGTTVDVFHAFVTQLLVPNLRPGDVVVMDNLSSHKHPSILKAIHDAGCSVVFTPPYSPEFNPIEEAWAKLKDILRRAETNTREAFDSALKHALDAIRESDIRGWVRFAGYRLNFN